MTLGIKIPRKTIGWRGIKKEKLDLIENLTKEMRLAASNLDFERAMELRDVIFDLEQSSIRKNR